MHSAFSFFFFPGDGGCEIHEFLGEHVKRTRLPPDEDVFAWIDSRYDLPETEREYIRAEIADRSGLTLPIHARRK